MAKVPPFGMPLDEIREELQRIRHPFRIAIRRSKNPFNVGAIIRTAHSFLVQEINLVWATLFKVCSFHRRRRLQTE